MADVGVLVVPTLSVVVSGADSVATLRRTSRAADDRVPLALSIPGAPSTEPRLRIERAVRRIREESQRTRAASRAEFTFGGFRPAATGRSASAREDSHCLLLVAGDLHHASQTASQHTASRSPTQLHCFQPAPHEEVPLLSALHPLPLLVHRLRAALAADHADRPPSRIWVLGPTHVPARSPSALRTTRRRWSMNSSSLSRRSFSIPTTEPARPPLSEPARRSRHPDPQPRHRRDFPRLQ